MRLYHILILVCLFCLAGCGRSTPTNYYLLEGAIGPITADGLPAKTLRVAQVETPAYLGRNNIVSRVKGETRLILAQFHVWAEPVSNGARRVIEETLTMPLLDKGIYVLPGGTEEHGDFVLVVDLQRLDGNFDEKAVLEASWTVLDRNDRPVDRGIFSAEEMVTGSDYNSLVLAESQLLRAFGKHLAERLPETMRTPARVR